MYYVLNIGLGLEKLDILQEDDIGILGDIRINCKEDKDWMMICIGWHACGDDQQEAYIFQNFGKYVQGDCVELLNMH